MSNGIFLVMVSVSPVNEVTERFCNNHCHQQHHFHVVEPLSVANSCQIVYINYDQVGGIFEISMNHTAPVNESFIQVI